MTRVINIHDALLHRSGFRKSPHMMWVVRSVRQRFKREVMAALKRCMCLLSLISIISTRTLCDTVTRSDEKVSTFTQTMLRRFYLFIQVFDINLQDGSFAEYSLSFIPSMLIIKRRVKYFTAFIHCKYLHTAGLFKLWIFLLASWFLFRPSSGWLFTLWTDDLVCSPCSLLLSSCYGSMVPIIDPPAGFRDIYRFRAPCSLITRVITT